MKIHIVLDNIRSVFNVGSIFRSADGAGYVEKIYLCGITTPIDNPKLEKTALGATERIKSEHYDNTQEAWEEIEDLEGIEGLIGNTIERRELQGFTPQIALPISKPRKPKKPKKLKQAKDVKNPLRI